MRTDALSAVYFTPEYVGIMLERAGRTLMMMPGTGCFPAKYRSFWPEIVRLQEEAYGYGEPEVRYRATLKQLTELDEVMTWLPLIRETQEARVLSYRMYTWPDSDRPVMSWRKIGRKLGIGHKEVQRIYTSGLFMLAAALRQRARR